MSVDDLYAERSNELKTLGYTVFEDAITEEQCSKFKKLNDQWFDNVAKESDFVDDPRFKNLVIPDTLSNNHFWDMRTVLNADHLVKFLKYHCNNEIVYLDHFDAHRNLSSGWHEDSNQKHFKNGNNHSNLSIYHPDYNVYRVCFYLQDHDEDLCGLHVKPGTHNFPKIQHRLFDNEVGLPTKKCDMIIFDCRLSHRGIQYKNSEMEKKGKNRHTIFLCLGSKHSIFSETHRMGAVQRQNRQLKRDSYKISENLKDYLESIGLECFENSSIFYK